jgi:hypothetical protein
MEPIAPLTSGDATVSLDRRCCSQEKQPQDRPDQGNALLRRSNRLESV